MPKERTFLKIPERGVFENIRVEEGENFPLVTDNFWPVVQKVGIYHLRYDFSRKTGTAYFKALATLIINR